MPETISRRRFCSLWPAISAAAQGHALEVRITSAGRPAAARVYIAAEDGRPHLLSGAVTYSRRGETHSVMDGGATALLPPGRYLVRAEKGPEFLAAEKSVTVSAGGAARVELDVPRFCGMAALGWYSGDLHIHRKAEEMPLLARAEDLNVAPVITRHVGGVRPAPPPWPEANVRPVDSTHIVTVQNQEVERLKGALGAVLLLNMPQPLPAVIPLLYPMDADFCRQARRAGAFVDGEKPIWKNVPVNAALGLLDSIGIVNNHFHPHTVMLDAEMYGSMERDEARFKTPAGFAEWMMELYYRLLNCGFSLPVSAGSASGIMPSWPGYERVYVRLSGPFSCEQWFRDLKAGRSVATNGPLLFASVNGQHPGARIAWTRPFEAPVDIEVRSQRDVERVEIVVNGRVAHALPGARSFRKTVPVKLSEPGWVAVRCIEPPGETVRYAHTSPFYFTRHGRLPVVKADAARWAAVVREIASWARLEAYPSPSAYEDAQKTLRAAEAVYRNLK